MEKNIDYDTLINAAKTLDKDSFKLVLEKMFEIQVNDVSDSNCASKCKNCSKKFKDECNHITLFEIELVSSEYSICMLISLGNINDFKHFVGDDTTFIKFNSGRFNDDIEFCFKKDHIDVSTDCGLYITMFKIGEKNMKILKKKIHDIVKDWIK